MHKNEYAISAYGSVASQNWSNCRNLGAEMSLNNQ